MTNEKTKKKDLLKKSNQNLEEYLNKDEFVNEKSKRRSPCDSIGVFSGLIGLNVAVYTLYNTFFDKYYVGETCNLQTRMFTHYNNLKNNASKNQEFQKDFNLLKEQGEDPFKFIQGDIVYEKYYLRVTDKNTVDNILQDLLTKEQKKIAELIQDDNKHVYNLSALIGIPCIVSGLFYPSITTVQEATGFSVERIKANLRDSSSEFKLAREIDRERLGFVSPTFSKESVSCILQDPIKNKEIVFSSCKQAENYFKPPNMTKQEQQEYVKLGVCTTRKSVGKALNRKDKFYRKV